MSGSSILQYVPSHFTRLRPQQIDVLMQIEKNWDRYDVFIINAPVATGKSLIAMTIASWAGEAAVLTPSNILLNQYADEFTNLHVIRKRSSYYCETLEQSVDKTYKQLKRYCGKGTCKGCDEYRDMVAAISDSNLILANYYAYMSYARVGSMKHTLIIDEGHNLTQMLRELGAKKFWQHDVHFPNNMKTRLDFMAWAEGLTEVQLSRHPSLRLLQEELRSNKPRHVFELTKAYHGKKSVDANDKLPVLKMIPVDTRRLDVGESLWPVQSVRKLVIMSATISQFDIEAFGLGKKRIKYIEVSSPIPAANRPIIIPEDRQNMAYKYQEQNMDKFLKFISEVAEHHNMSKGFIHAPYSVAKVLRMRLENNSRFMFHGRGRDKITKLEEWKASEEPKIFVGSGMNEGISLNYDLCRWQVICKVPFPSLADPALRYLASTDSTWYAWQSLKDLLQASGRNCRSEDDWGCTYLWDECAVRLIQNNKDLIPMWFQEALIIEPKIAS